MWSHIDKIYYFKKHQEKNDLIFPIFSPVKALIPHCVTDSITIYVEITV